jgi:hypothetical protein
VCARRTEAKAKKLSPRLNLRRRGNGNLFTNRIGLDKPCLGTIPLALAPVPRCRLLLTVQYCLWHVDTDTGAGAGALCTIEYICLCLCLCVFKLKLYLMLLFKFLRLRLRAQGQRVNQYQSSSPVIVVRKKKCFSSPYLYHPHPQNFRCCCCCRHSRGSGRRCSGNKLNAGRGKLEHYHVY